MSATRTGDRVTVVPATIEHVYALADRLRPADEAEVRGLGHTPRKALYRGFRNSVLCRAGLVEGRCAAMWGVAVGQVPGACLLGSLATPWLLTSADVEAVPLAYLRVGRAELAAMRALYPQLAGYVAADYAAAVRWLRMIGFTVDAPVPLGPFGKLYARYHIGLADV